jgi:exosome complex component RRP41
MVDYLRIIGLRTDGRLPTESRTIKMELGIHSDSDGSVSLEMGQTKIWASCRGPRESSNKTGISIDITSAPFSTMERKRLKQDGRKMRELAQRLESAFSRIVEVNLFPRSCVDISIQVLQNDGGVSWACFNACSLALVDAGVPMRDLCIACGVWFGENQMVLVDPCSAELTQSGGELWMGYSPQEDKMLTCQFSGKVSESTLGDLLQQGEKACKQMFTVISSLLASSNSSNPLEFVSIGNPEEDDE